MENKDNIAIEGVSWKPQKEQDFILKDIEAAMEPGHIYGIIGPNGAGKTTLLKHILKFIPYQTGSICLGGRDIKAMKSRALACRLAFVPQNTSADTTLGCDFSARDMVLMGRNPYKKRFEEDSEEDFRLAEHAMELTESSEYADRKYSMLSAGEAQRVIIARALAQSGTWIVLDEPIANLDIRNQREILDNLKRLNMQKNISLLMILHDINLAREYCDRIIMMKKGKIICCGDSDRIINKEQLKLLYDIDFVKLEAEDGRVFFYPQKNEIEL